MLNHHPRTIPHRQSLFRSVLFISFALFLSISATYAAAAGDKAANSGKLATIRLEADVRIPVGHQADYWKPHVLGGISIDLPTHYERVSVRISGQGGILKGTDLAARKKCAVLHETIAVLFLLPPRLSIVEMSPMIGLTNTTVYLYDEFTLRALDIIATSENEFGLLGGVEFAIRKGKISIGFPVACEFVLSMPYPIVTINIGLSAGITF